MASGVPSATLRTGAAAAAGGGTREPVQLREGAEQFHRHAESGIQGKDAWLTSGELGIFARWHTSYAWQNAGW